MRRSTGLLLRLFLKESLTRQPEDVAAATAGGSVLKEVANITDRRHEAAEALSKHEQEHFRAFQRVPEVTHQHAMALHPEHQWFLIQSPRMSWNHQMASVPMVKDVGGGQLFAQQLGAWPVREAKPTAQVVTHGMTSAPKSERDCAHPDC